MSDTVSLKILVDTVKGIAGLKKMGDSLVSVSKESKETDKAFSRLSWELKKAEAGLVHAARKTDVTAKELRELDKKTKEAAEKLKFLASGSKKASKALKNTGDSADEGSKKVNHLSGALKTFISIAAILGTVKKGIGIASEFEDYKNTLEVVMKDTKKAGDMFQWAVKTANKTPFDTKDMIEGTVRLTSYGISAKKTMGYIGDMAAVMNTDLMQAVEAVSDAQTGELERLKQYGITKQMIIDQANSMELNGVVNAKGQITDIENFNKALFALMKNKFDGGMVKKSKTFSGALSTISGVINTSMSSIMGIGTNGEIVENSIFDTLKDGALSLADSLVKLQETGELARWGEEIAASLKTAGEFTKKYGEDILFVAKTVAVLMGVWKMITVIGTATNAIRGITAAYQTAATAQKGFTVAQWAFNAAMTANPIGVIIAALTALIGVGYLVHKNWDALKDKAFEFWEALDNNPIGKIIKFFLKFLTPLGQIYNLFKGIQNLWDRFKGQKDLEINLKENITRTVDNKKESDPLVSNDWGNFNKTNETKIDGSHRTGISYIPKDGYLAELHKGERVLTSNENKKYNSKSESKSNVITITIEKLFDSLTIQKAEDKDLDEITDKVAEKFVSKLNLAMANLG